MSLDDEVEKIVGERIAEIVEKRSSILKAKYREQAMKAVADARKEGFQEGLEQTGGSKSAELVLNAEKDGYDRAKEEFASALRKAEDEFRRLKALEVMINSNFADGCDNKGVNSAEETGPMVQYIIEQVYRDVKSEFKDPNTVKRMKNALIHSNEVLQRKLPNLMLMPKSGVVASNKSSNNDNSNINSKSCSSRSRIPRAFKLFCMAQAPPLRKYIHVQIPYSVKRSKIVKGIFVNGKEEVVVYGISASIYHLSHARELLPADNMQFTERRWSEFKSLFSALKKEFPKVVIPPLPDGNMLDSETLSCLALGHKHELVPPSVSLLNGANALDVSGAEKTKMQVRQYLAALWLAAVANHPVLQTNILLTAFIFGTDSATARNTKESLRAILDTHGGLAVERSMLLTCSDHHKQQEKQQKQQHTGVGIPKYMFELAVKDVGKIDFDAKRVRKSLGQLMSACATLNTLASGRYKVMGKMGSYFAEYGIKESAGCALCMGSDTLGWGVVANSLGNAPTQRESQQQNDTHKNSDPPTPFEAKDAVVSASAGLSARLLFVDTALSSSLAHTESCRVQLSRGGGGGSGGGGSGTTSGSGSSSSGGGSGGSDDNERASIDSIGGGRHSFSGGAPSPTRDPLTGAASALGVDTDAAPTQPLHQELAVGAAEEYDMNRKLRAVSLLQGLRQTAVSMAEAHKKSKEAWGNTLADLLDLNLDFDSACAKPANAYGAEIRKGASALAGDDSGLFERHRSLNLTMRSKKKAQRDFVRSQCQLRGKSFPWMVPGEEDKEEEEEEEENMKDEKKKVGTDTNDSNTSPDRASELNQRPSSGSYSIFRRDGSTSSPGVAGAATTGPREWSDYRRVEEEKEEEGAVDVQAAMDKPIVPLGKRARARQILSGIFPSLAATPTGGGDGGGGGGKDEEPPASSATESGGGKRQAFQDMLFGPSSLTQGVGSFLSRDRFESDDNCHDDDDDDDDGDHRGSLFDTRDSEYAEEIAVANGGGFDDDDDDEEEEEEDLFAPGSRAPSTGPPLDDDETEMKQALAEAGEDDTPMNRAILRQAMKRREKEDEDSRRRHESHNLKQRQNEGAYDANDRRLAQRAHGKNVSNNPSRQARSRVSQRHTHGTSSSSNSNNASLNDELFGAPKPAESKRSAAAGAGGAGSSNYFDGMVPEMPEIPTRTAAAPPAAAPAPAATAPTTTGSAFERRGSGAASAAAAAAAASAQSAERRTSSGGTAAAATGSSSHPATGSSAFERRGSGAAAQAAAEAAAERRGSNGGAGSMKTSQSSNSQQLPKTPRRSDKTATPPANSSTSTSSGTGSTRTRENISGDGDGDDLPEGWQKVLSGEDGRAYYYHEVSRLSRWEKPSAKLASQHAERLQESMAREEAEVIRKRDERKREEDRAEAEAETRREMTSDVKKRIQAWRKKGRFKERTKNILELLVTVHDMCDFVPEDPAGAAASSSNPAPTPKNAEVKKAYMKVVRHIHPDKLPAGLPLEQKVVAEAVFVFLTEEYNAWREQEGA